jgi:hypothetical protein
MSTWVAYAGASLLLVAAAALVCALALSGAAEAAVWFSAALAWTLQLLAFGGLVAVRHQPTLFTAGWLGGMMLRFMALAALVFFGSSTAAFPLKPLLVSFVTFLFLLVLLESVFLRRGLRTS